MLQVKEHTFAFSVQNLTEKQVGSGRVFLFGAESAFSGFVIAPRKSRKSVRIFVLSCPVRFRIDPASGSVFLFGVETAFSVFVIAPRKSPKSVRIFLLSFSIAVNHLNAVFQASLLFCLN